MRRKRVHVGYVTITGTRKTLPRPRNKQKETLPGRGTNKTTTKQKKPNRCGNHKGHSRSLTPPIKKPSRRGATSAPRDLHTILPHLPKMRRSALPTSAEKKRRARVELGKKALKERSTVGDHRLRRLFCLGLRRLRRLRSGILHLLIRRGHALASARMPQVNPANLESTKRLENNGAHDCHGMIP